ncbi:tape measure protein [Klebsiella pneumoniae]|uniref:tape measure protein n=1 Tax=Klebsiella pneumoniae TaxID=573 RepID=UPI0007CBEA0C|nr:tape measure protein [Klebsiella pneumoniae]SAU86215.1 phage tape measure protein [Klebsiella pneumoniae]
MAENAGGIYYDIEMDIQGLLVAQQRVNQRLDMMERGFDGTTRAVNNTERSMFSLSGVAVALTAALSVKQMAEYADAWATVNNKLANSLRPNEQLADVTERVFNITQQTRSSLDATASLYARLERATRQYGTSADDLAKLTTIINQGFVVSGATAQEAENAIIQLSQGLASGALRGEEFNSVNEQGNRLIIALADSMGVSIGQMRNMAAQGKLTTDVVVNGLLSQGAVIGKEFANTTTTISQALQVAGNNITKFFGENSTVKTSAGIFNDAVVTASENIGLLSGALTAVAAIMGSRYVGALTMATAAKVQDTAASIAQSKAASVAAKDAEIEAAAKLRLAEVEKAAAISALNLAEGRLATLKTTNASVAAEVQLAEAQTAEIRTQLAQIQSEKALEAQRLKAQISDQGRIATATRMAELRQAEAALTTQLARAESATQNARATAIVQAEAQVSASRLATADATATATAANARYIASQEAATIASRSASVAGGVLRGALGLIGGPAGVAMLAAAAIFYFWQKAQQAREEALRFADSLDRVNASMKAMNNTQLRGTIADANKSIRAQKDEISDLQSEVDSLRSRYQNFTPEAQAVAESMGQGADFARQQAEVSDQLNQKTRDLANAQDKLARTQDTAAEANRTLTNNMLTSMGVHDGLIQKGWSLEQVQGAVAKAFGLTADEINRANQAGQNFNPKALQVSPPTADGDKVILNLEEQNELLKIQDERQRAVTKARMQAAKVTDNPNQISRAGDLAGENYDLQKAEEARQEAQRKGEQQDKRSASAAESVAQKLENLRQQSELAAGSTQELSREQAVLQAQQSLGKGATQEQIALAGKYRGEIWDTANALKAQAAAEKLLPEARENASYQQDVKDLQTALAAKKITQQQYNQTSEQLEAQHQVNLAKIRAQQTVSPMQEARGQIDPVQQLANQHAQELALIQQFETQKGQITQRGLELMNAANTQYEQQRIAAQWEIWRQQNAGYEVAAAAFDSFAGNASNALTGIITGSMSVSEAMRSLGSTVLNSVINSFVQMGVEWLKSVIMGQAGMTAASGMAIAQGQLIAASMAPAAAMTSLATAGANAVPAQAGIASTVGMAQALSIAGARYNGGPVSAGGLYQVGEKGKPEIYQASTGKQYMIPGDNGKVISNKDMQSGGGISVQVNVINQSTGATVQSANGYMQDGSAVVDLLITDMERGGPVSSQMQQTFGLSRKAQGAY